MPQSICLNMIVKNEAGAIKRCLDAVKPHIGHWVIVDTGSTDGTQDIIRDHLRDIPGTLHERPWRDFSSNRNEAIALAKGHGDYLLFMDADDLFTAPAGFTFPPLTAGGYHLNFLSPGMSYWRTALVSQSLPWHYVGVLHEYLECTAPHTLDKLAGPQIVHNFDGGEPTEAERIAKYTAHAAIFEKALASEPGNARHAFYLAQSYRDADQFDSAIAAYDRRIAMPGWDQETYCAHLQGALLAERLQQPFEAVLKRYLAAYEFRPARAESMVELARYCRERQRYALAQLFAARAVATPMTSDILFVRHECYTWRGRDELSIAQYWTGDFASSAALCTALLASTDLPEAQRARVADNLAFARAKLAQAT